MDAFQRIYDDPRLPVLQGMFDMIPDGYFAVELGDGSPLQFYRINTRKVGVYKGKRTIQTQHSESYIMRAVISPDGTWMIRPGMSVDHVALVIADHKSAARAYALEIGKCCRCNTKLTDERSRHYGIGPECEKHWPWMLEMVDLQNDGVAYQAG